MPPEMATMPPHTRSTMAAVRSAFRRAGSCYSSRPVSTRLRESYGGQALSPLEVVVNRRHLAPWTFLLGVAFALLPLSATRLGGQAQPRPGVVALKGGTILTA